MKVNVLKYDKSYTSLSLNVFLLIADKAQFIPIEKLVLPPKNGQIMEVDDGFLKQLITNMEDQPTGNYESYEALFVFAKGIKKKEEFSIEKNC